MPAADEGELDSVDHGDEERVAAHHGSDSESDKDKQRKIAANIEQLLTHDPTCYMCAVCLEVQNPRAPKAQHMVGLTCGNRLRGSVPNALEIILFDSVALEQKAMTFKTMRTPP